MGEVRKEVKTFRVYRECDECKVGFMEPTGHVGASKPLAYQHECSRCGLVKYFYGKKYPMIMHKEVVEDV